MNSLDRFAVAWTMMWGLSYIIVAIIAPTISDTPSYGYTILGSFILLCLLLRYFIISQQGDVFILNRRIGVKENLHCYTIVRALFFALGTVMTYGSVASWTGLSRWNIPFVVVDLFQVSMAFADLISAAFMFNLAITKEVR